MRFLSICHLAMFILSKIEIFCDTFSNQEKVSCRKDRKAAIKNTKKPREPPDSIYPSPTNDVMNGFESKR
ncbi:unnamed protein product [Caenorhabditis angaria]|uniref:Uncharacterized protein n=1 Tax=Caenorhabditis angaria TaxID=860376 RepID=A0A9P1IND9_9PELO|nr:unnamed protein product [Caenorhabditis angaria]